MKKNYNRNIEVDLLRGAAIVFMLLSHSAAQWLSSEDNQNGLSGVLAFIGSFAPVVFFFVTGVGYGLSHRVGHTSAFAPVAYKAVILIVMDAFMRNNFKFFLGWDFLAFIGFSMLLLHFLKGRARALEWTLLLAGFLFLIRYALPIVVEPLKEPEYKIIAILSGSKSLEGVSYWFTPWLIYSLVGFIIGILHNKYHSFWEQKRRVITGLFLFLGVAILFLSLYLQGRGMIYFRWGTVSVNFFIISFSVLSLLLFFVCFLVDNFNGSFLIRLLSISGVSSLAVVPIHYFILNITENYFSEGFSAQLYYIVCPTFIGINIFLAARVDALIEKNKKVIVRKYVLVIAFLTVLCAVFLLISNVYLLNLVMALAAQLLLCVLIMTPYTLFFVPDNNARMNS